MPQVVEIKGYGKASFPDDATPEQIQDTIRKNFPDPTMSQGAAALTGFNVGGGRVAQGELQPLLEGGMLGDSIAQSSKNVANQRENDYNAASQQWPKTTLTSSIVGSGVASAPILAIPGLGTSRAAKIGSNILQDAGIGLSMYTPGNNLEDRLINTGAAVLGGRAGAGIARGTEVLLAKPINAAKGVLQEGAQKVIDLGKKYNVPVFASDAAPTGSALKSVGAGLDNTPIVGTRGERRAQMRAQKQAAQTMTDQAHQAMSDAPYGGLTGISALQAATIAGGKRSKEAGKALDMASGAGDDWNRVTQASGNVKIARAKIIADKKYDKVEELANKYGDVPRNNSLTSIENAIEDVSNGVLPDQGLIKQLQTIKENMSSKPMDFTAMRKARSDIGGLVSDYYKGNNAAIGAKGSASLQSIKNNIEKDMNVFAQSKDKQLKTVWKNADNFYNNYLVPFKDRSVAQAMKNASPDEIYGQFIKTGSREGDKGTGRASIFYNALDNKGKAAVRYGMISNALDKAVKTQTGLFSPARFASELEKYAAAKGVFFKGGAKAEVDGLTNLMRHTEESFKALKKPETGKQGIPYLIGLVAGGTAMVSPILAAAAAGGTYGLKKLMTSDSGRKILLASSKIAPNSPSMQRMVDSARKLMETGGAIGNANQGIDRQQNQ
jgi:hypothetical protein